jgi:hypothetical protein
MDWAKSLGTLLACAVVSANAKLDILYVYSTGFETNEGYNLRLELRTGRLTGDGSGGNGWLPISSPAAGGMPTSASMLGGKDEAGTSGDH